MPDESCRRCGGALELIRKCSECKKPLEQICTMCANAITDAVHACINNTIVRVASKNTWAASA
ncbi:MAG: hypothetical protein QW177_07220 [Candidatus Nitrosotenuis sp.]|nr:hypothetical protein [Candidatus Nitrosotenuis sp.]